MAFIKYFFNVFHPPNLPAVPRTCDAGAETPFFRREAHNNKACNELSPFSESGVPGLPKEERGNRRGPGGELRFCEDIQ